MSITINEDDFSIIKSVLAYPSTDNLLLDDPEIKNLCIRPALRKYFTKFPIKHYETRDITSDTTLAINLIDTYIYGVLDVRIVGKNTVAGSGSAFWDIVKYQNLTSPFKVSGMYGKQGYNPNSLLQQNILRKQTIASLQNTFDTVKYWIDTENSVLNIYSSVTGKLDITWAKYSDNFDTGVLYNHKEDVIKLSQANLLLQFVDTTSMITDSSQESTINTDTLKTRAQELMEAVEKKWTEYPDVIVMRLV